ncbi:MAG: HDOD domain-containing protein [Desulfobacterales bacterium]|nr:HDOD domain-containing protein [Desulfobacterales bacterium]
MPETQPQSIVAIFDYLATKDIRLPVFDRTAQQIQQEITRENVDQRVIENLIVQDQALTSQVLKVANSSFYKGLSEITTVRNAIVRLGLKEVANIVTLVSHRQHFKATDPQARKLMNSLWRHSVACGLGAKWLAAQGGVDVQPNEAFFAGLLHDVGKLFIITVIEKLKKSKQIKQLPSMAVVDEVIDSLHCKHGYILMKNWNLPERYCLIVRDHHAADFDGENHLLTIVRLADHACNKAGLGLRPNDQIVLSATREASLLGLSDVALAKLEIHLEDAGMLAE